MGRKKKITWEREREAGNRAGDKSSNAVGSLARKRNYWLTKIKATPHHSIDAATPVESVLHPMGGQSQRYLHNNL